MTWYITEGISYEEKCGTCTKKLKDHYGGAMTRADTFCDTGGNPRRHWTDVAKVLRTSGQCRRDEVRAGECFMYANSSSSIWVGTTILVWSITSSGALPKLPAGWNWSDRTGFGNGPFDDNQPSDSLVDLHPRWDAISAPVSILWSDSSYAIVKWRDVPDDVTGHWCASNWQNLITSLGVAPGVAHTKKEMTDKGFLDFYCKVRLVDLPTAAVVVALAPLTVVKEDNKWPHLCYGCGGPAYHGWRSQCKKSCRPEWKADS